MQFYDNVENTEIVRNSINDHVFYFYSLGFFYFLIAKGWFLSLQIGCCSVNFQVYEIIKSVFSIDNSEVIKGTVPTSGVHYLW